MKQLLKQIRDNNILLEVVDGKLKVFADQATLNKELIDLIRERQNELLQFLLNNDPASTDNTFQTSIQPIPDQKDYPLSSAQLRLWILSQLEDASVAYNMSGLYLLEGDLNHPILNQAFNSLIERHEILRTNFKENQDGEIRQYIHPAAETSFALRAYDC